MIKVNNSLWTDPSLQTVHWIVLLKNKIDVSLGIPSLSCYQRCSILTAKSRTHYTSKKVPLFINLAILFRKWNELDLKWVIQSTLASSIHSFIFLIFLTSIWKVPEFSSRLACQFSLTKIYLNLKKRKSIHYVPFFWFLALLNKSSSIIQ